MDRIHRHDFPTKRKVTPLDIFPASRIKLTATPISVLLLLIYSPVGIFLATCRLIIFSNFIFFSLLQQKFFKSTDLKSNKPSSGSFFNTFQKLLLSLCGIFPKIDEKILFQNLQKHYGFNQSYVYLSNWSNYLDTFILPVYLANLPGQLKTYKIKPNLIKDKVDDTYKIKGTADSLIRGHKYYHQPTMPLRYPESIFYKLIKQPFESPNFLNSIYFPEHTPSAAQAILKYVGNDNFERHTKSKEQLAQVNFVPIFTHVQNNFLAVENCTIYSTFVWDLLVMLFCPVTIRAFH